MCAIVMNYGSENWNCCHKCKWDCKIRWKIGKCLLILISCHFVTASLLLFGVTSNILKYLQYPISYFNNINVNTRRMFFFVTFDTFSFKKWQICWKGINFEKQRVKNFHQLWGNIFSSRETDDWTNTEDKYFHNTGWWFMVFIFIISILSHISRIPRMITHIPFFDGR